MKNFKSIKSTISIFIILFMMVGVFGNISHEVFAQTNTGGGGAVTGEPSSGGGGAVTGTPSSGGGGSVNPDSVFTLQNPLKANSIGGAVQAFVEIFSYLAVILAVLVFIWIGFLFVLAQGKPEKIKDLKVWLGWTVVGVAVIIGARLMIDVIINTLSATKVVNPNVIESARRANSGN